MDRISRNSLLLSLAFASLYGLGMLLPQPLWGLSHLAYLSPFQALAMLLIALGMPFLWRFFLKPNPKPLPTSVAKIWLPLGLALVSAVLVYAFPLAQDSYGDALSFRANIDFSIDQYKPILLDEVLYFNLFDPKIGSGSFYAFVNMTAWLTGKSGIESLYLLEVILVALFTWIWTRWVLRKIDQPLWQIAMVAAGLCSPVFLIFTGHFETYAFSITAILGYLSMLDKHFCNPSLRSLLGLVVLWLVCLKFHFISHLLLPSLGLAALWLWGKEKNWVQRLLTWKYALRYLLLPGFVGLLLIYLIPFGGWNISRSFTIDTLNEAFFLPVVGPDPPPLDRYNLFSFVHLLDFANMIFLWAPGALFLGLGLLFTRKKTIQWESPVLIAFVASMLVFGTVFFLLNPLLTMPVDWDLLSLPAPVFMGLVLVMLGQVEERQRVQFVALDGLGIVLLGWMFWWLHLSPEAIGDRYINTGKWGFKTYWVGTSTQVLQGLRLQPDRKVQFKRFEQALAELEPYAHPGDDVEYAGLLLAKGEMHFRDQAFDKAREMFELSHTYHAQLLSLPYFLVTSLFMEKQFSEAAKHCPELVRQGYPSQGKAWRMAIHTCIEAGNAEAALEYAVLLARDEPEDSFNNKVVKALRNGKSTSEMRSWFRQN